MAREKGFYSFDEIKDEFIGKAGTPEREEYESRLKEEIQSCFVGEAIKNARVRQNLTQEELGERLGVKRSQISKLENGKSSITLFTMARVFRALGITTATLDLGPGGKVSLW